MTPLSPIAQREHDLDERIRAAVHEDVGRHYTRMLHRQERPIYREAVEETLSPAMFQFVDALAQDQPRYSRCTIGELIKAGAALGIER